ncbi:hypothetical protein ET495_12940 [Xylanimonas allomyrinae]|uniref:Uncharacterized protein n=1 Tax=Xylanimonas allomyrinae TaxID=2509459 RepID=A0A4P6ENC0_9MICO|nr:hypothetical protein [Xylanimonas allomyrinae]QAY63985.1 hypothetical protein ET495_12940 [Xylanimonas allomyrinae]
MLVALIAGAAWAVNRVISPFEPPASVATSTETGGSPDPTDGAATAPTPADPEVVRPVIATAEQVGPAASCRGEQPETAVLAVDGDPSTFWFTCTYSSPTFGGLKDGIGFTVTLREPATVNSMTILSNSAGGHVEVRKATSANPTEGPVLAEGAFAATTELTFAQPVVGDSFVIWITELPTTEGSNRLELSEITLQ